VRRAIGAECKHPIDRVLKRAALTGQRRLRGFLNVVPDGLRLVGDLQAHSQAEIRARWDIEFVLLQRRRSLRHYLIPNDRQTVLDLLLRHEVAGTVGAAAIRTERLPSVRDTGPGLYLEEFLAREISAFATDVSVCIDEGAKR